MSNLPHLRFYGAKDRPPSRNDSTRDNGFEWEPSRDVIGSLATRSGLLEEIEQLVGSSSASTSALLSLDLDRFTLVKDGLGRRQGELFLCSVAESLQETIRDNDLAARTGEDEFAVCLPDLESPAEAHSIAEQVYEGLSQPTELEGHTIFSPPSIGIVIDLSGYDDVDEVLRHASTAMHAAKGEPHQSLAIYEPSMTRRVEQKLVMDTELRQALERSEFVPFFQPIIALDEGRVHGFEVLARWRHPDRGLLSPAAFLEAAEATGLIVPIGHQVIRKACEVIRDLRRKRNSNDVLTLMANFSRQEFFREETHAFLTELFEAFDMTPENFTMEISERTVADVSENDFSVFCTLKDLGVKIVLDDFGTGFSSLQSVRHLPVDGLKIDKDLLADTRGHTWDSELLDLIVQMGHTLDQTVTAEGVERVPQLDALRDMGCSYAQGFLFARPLPASDIERLLEEPFRARFWNT